MGGRDLIRQAQDGDEAALASLLSAHREQLRQMADRALPDRLKARVDASDIVQQTCLSALRQIEQFEGNEPAQFAAWLCQIHDRNIKNAVRDQLQTQKRGDGREVPLEGDAAAGITPSQHAMQRESEQLLAQSLDQLPADEREVLRLRYIEGQTLGQISEHLGVTKDAVVWQMQKGMKRLRKLLPREEN